MADILLIAGLSGAGRSQAADDLEDLGWFVVDNMPIALIEKVVELAAAGEQSQLALVVGTAVHQTDAVVIVQRLREVGHRVRILFLDASTPELVRRYGATKRKHPLASRFSNINNPTTYSTTMTTSWMPAGTEMLFAISTTPAIPTALQ